MALQPSLRQPVGKDVRGPAPVCLCCRGVCESRAWGAADAAFGAGKSGRVAADGHFVARPAAALPIPAEKARSYIEEFFVISHSVIRFSYVQSK